MKHEHLKIDPAVDVVVEANGHVRFVTPRGDLPVADPFGLVKRLAHACLLGTTDEALTRSCKGAAEREAMLALIERLKDKQVLTNGDDRRQPDLLGEWLRHLAGAKGRGLPSIHLEGDGVLADAFRARLQAHGFTLPTEYGAEQCLVAVSDNADLRPLRKHNEVAVKAGQPFFPVWLDRGCAHWGPMVLPGATACLECLWHREQAASRRTYYSPPADTDTRAASPAVAELAATLAIAELMRWALKAHVDTEVGVAWCFDTLKTDLSAAKVLKLPRCGTCGLGQ